MAQRSSKETSVAVDWHRADASRIYEFINRRWKEETGQYPGGDEPGIIVMMVAILAEYHDMMCDGAEITGRYVKRLPDEANRGTLRAVPPPREWDGTERRR